MKKIIFFLALLCTSPFMLASTDIPEEATLQTQTTENWKKLFKQGLFNKKGKKVSVAETTKKKYIGIYTSASWCGPCRVFTPKLIEFYEENKSKIDIILIGSHYTKEDVCQYMTKYDMPWAGTYVSGPIEDFFKRHNIVGIPDFRVFSRDGRLLIKQGAYLEEVKKLLDGKK